MLVSLSMSAGVYGAGTGGIDVSSSSSSNPEQPAARGTELIMEAKPDTQLEDMTQ